MWNKKGFSLMELMVVVGIITILSTIGLVSYSKYVRKGSQLEAKQNLALAYRTQLSYYEDHLQFTGNMRKINAIPPAGPMFYNIGAVWSGASGDDADFTSLNLNDPIPTNNLCPCCDGSSSYPNRCCLTPNHSKKPSSAQCGDSSYNKCYGTGNIQNDVTTAVSDTTFAFKTNTILPVAGQLPQFVYYAVGCVSGGRQKAADLDVWSINEKKLLQNIENATL